ncbi:ubiquinone biosynthesis protein COQ4, mitochondrial [Kwoniella newhampshirensis]|uniref:4-hydroxy-3-methoxy-5-polyprenylbenzoate decarboxylase n=1 Tax=Kwoniella newhampshirensis TaxID=1651941 RepID=A0AAW0YJL3_9TREE
MRSSFRLLTAPQPTPNYPGHIPLTLSQTVLLALGSGIVGVLDVTRGDLIASLSESTASVFLPSLHAKMASHPEGRQIMSDRPRISWESVKRDRLGEMRRGTVGREYWEWLKGGEVTPDTRAEVQYIDSPTLAYTMLRYRQTHDLYHTLFSLPPTLPHELSLKVLEFTNMSLPVAGLSSTFGPLRLNRRATWTRDWVPWALRTGREGKSLVGVYWEKRWEQGVGELRRELGVKRNDMQGVEGRWGGYRKIRELERELRRKGEWVDEPEEW